MKVTARLSKFAERLVRALDSRDPGVFLDADDAIQVKGASGGRLAAGSFFISYRANDSETWSIALTEPDLRRLAAGALKTVDVEVSRREVEPRAVVGDAFAVWGSGPDEGCRLGEPADVDRLLASLRRAAASGARSLAIGSSHGDCILFAAVSSDEAMLAMTFAGGDVPYLTSRGDPSQSEPITVPVPLTTRTIATTWGNCIGFDDAARAAKALAFGGDVDRAHFAVTVAMDVVSLAERLRELRGAFSKRVDDANRAR